MSCTVQRLKLPNIAINDQVSRFGRNMRHYVKVLCYFVFRFIRIFRVIFAISLLNSAKALQNNAKHSLYINFRDRNISPAKH